MHYAIPVALVIGEREQDVERGRRERQVIFRATLPAAVLRDREARGAPLLDREGDDEAGHTLRVEHVSALVEEARRHVLAVGSHAERVALQDDVHEPRLALRQGAAVRTDVHPLLGPRQRQIARGSSGHRRRSGGGCLGGRAAGEEASDGEHDSGGDQAVRSVRHGNSGR